MCRTFPDAVARALNVSFVRSAGAQNPMHLPSHFSGRTVALFATPRFFDPHLPIRGRAWAPAQARSYGCLSACLPQWRLVCKSRAAARQAESGTASLVKAREIMAECGDGWGICARPTQSARGGTEGERKGSGRGRRHAC